MTSDYDLEHDPWARQPQPGDGVSPEAANILGDWACEQNAKVMDPQAEEELTGLPPEWWDRQEHEPLWQYSQRIADQLKYGFAAADRAERDLYEAEREAEA